MLPDSVIESVEERLLRVQRLHQEDLAKGGGAVQLPDALDCKYPNSSCIRPSAPPASTSASPATRSAAASPRTCWRIIMISAPCKSTWATGTSKLP